ncbi:MAG: hypothetical protein QXM50_06885 [Candidatus Caldarchaeum sp.]
MRIPDFIKGEDELGAYLAMILACEGYITWQPKNERKTNEPTAETDVAVLTNTNEILFNEVENILRRLGYTPSKTAYSKKVTKT